MNKELLDILNELSKKDTTDLAMSCMELQADVLVKENEKEELQEKIKELEEEIIDLRADYGTKTQVERDLAVDKIQELQAKVNKAWETQELLEHRIDKAIDLLEYGKKASYLVTDIFINDLIEILKGEE